ncbi:MAG TPA: S8 family serine peptidase [Chloroflexota bacterium]
MPAFNRRSFAFLISALVASATLLIRPAAAAADTPTIGSPYASVADAVKAGFLKQESVDSAAKRGTAPIIVQLKLPTAFRPEGALAGTDELDAQRQAIRTAQDAVVQKLAQFKPEHVKRYQSIPHLALEANSAALDALVKLPNLTRVAVDRERAGNLSNSIPFIGGDRLRNSLGSAGSGQAVAILDTGVEIGHSFFNGRVVSEACFSTDSWWHSTDSFCPNGGDSQAGAGTAAPCPIGGCDHGTHVAGIAAGRGSTMNGVAPEANIIAMKVFLQENDQDDCQNIANTNAPCALARDSDVIGALERALSIGPGLNLAAVNLSLGGGNFANQSDCDSDNSDYKDAIDNLRSVGIATVISSGNGAMPIVNGVPTFRQGLAAPGCISSAISVGATSDVTLPGENVAGFSQTANFLNLLAPGTFINSSVPGNGFGFMTGTSMAAPHVTGAWAALRSIAGNQNVPTILNALSSTGTPVLDNRINITRPRINLVGAAEQLTAKPLTPSNLRVTSLTGTTATLRWNDNSQSETVFALEFQRVTPASALWIVGATPGRDVTSASITGLSPNVAYNFRVMACNGPACSAVSNVVNATTVNTLPSVPTNLRSANVTNGSFDVLWDEVSANPFTSFDVYSNVSGSYASRSFASSTSTFINRRFSASGLAANSSYWAQVRACNADGCSAYSGWILVTTLTIVPIPAAPTDLHMCGTVGIPPFGELCLAGPPYMLWRDNATDETSYELQWTMATIGQNPYTGPWSTVNLPANAHTYAPSTPTSGALYYFRVRACNIGGCSAWSNTLTYTAP